MIGSDYWTIKEHTERKLEILDKYLNAWCDIIFSHFAKNKWTFWQTPYFIDCFAGRGMYHKEDKLDSVKGSPLIAIETFIQKKRYYEAKHNSVIYPRVILIEYNSQFATELRNFVSIYQNEIHIQVICNDFNTVIEEVVAGTGSSPALFFVDAGGIKELHSKSVECIVSKKGARDILLNYIVEGPKRVGGLAQSLHQGTYSGKDLDSALKTIKTLEDFMGMPSVKYLETLQNDMRKALLAYIDNVLHANNKIADEKNKLQTIAYDMKNVKRQRLVYFLLFTSREKVAKK